MRYSADTLIAAPDERVWSIITDGAAYTSWDSGVTKRKGTIADGEKIKVYAAVANLSLEVVQLASDHRLSVHFGDLMRPSPADVRRWACARDIVVSDRGRIPVAVMDQYLQARARGES